MSKSGTSGSSLPIAARSGGTSVIGSPSVRTRMYAVRWIQFHAASGACVQRQIELGPRRPRRSATIGCRRRRRRPPSTPAIHRVDSQQAIRLPMGSCPGNARAASASLTIITLQPAAPIVGRESAPFTIGTRIVAKKSGVMMRSWL